VELALNLVWLVLAAVSFLLGVIYAPSFPRRYSNFAAAIALICVTCFLFPVISITDDLNNNPALCETSKSKRSASSDDLAGAPLRSEMAVLPHPGPAMGQVAHRMTEVPPPREHVWFNLDRRPPPPRS